MGKCAFPRAAAGEKLISVLLPTEHTVAGPAALGSWANSPSVLDTGVFVCLKIHLWSATGGID